MPAERAHRYPAAENPLRAIDLKGKTPGKLGERLASLESIRPGDSVPFYRPLTGPLGGRCLLPLLLKTFAAEDWSSLRRFEGNGGVLATLRTSGSGLGFGGRLSRNRRPQNGNSLCLTGFATLRLVFELLIVKEQLFARGENKV